MLGKAAAAVTVTRNVGLSEVLIMAVFERLVALRSFQTIEIFYSLKSPRRENEGRTSRTSSHQFDVRIEAAAFSDWIRAKVL